jgi:hypothetical protein
MSADEISSFLILENQECSWIVVQNSTHLRKGHLSIVGKKHVVNECPWTGDSSFGLYRLSKRIKDAWFCRPKI